MAKAILAFPEEDIRDVVECIREGTKWVKSYELHDENVLSRLEEWCREQEKYAERDARDTD